MDDFGDIELFYEDGDEDFLREYDDLLIFSAETSSAADLGDSGDDQTSRGSSAQFSTNDADRDGIVDKRTGSGDCSSDLSNSNRLKKRRTLHWRTAQLPKRPKILKDDPRRSYMQKWCIASNTGDVASIWEFLQQFATQDMKFTLKFLGSPPPPFDLVNPNVTVYGRAACCEFVYSRIAVIPDNILTPKDTRIIIRSDGTAWIRSAGDIRGSPVVGVKVMLMFERNVLTMPFRVVSSNSSSNSSNNDSIGSISTTDSGSNNSDSSFSSNTTAVKICNQENIHSLAAVDKRMIANYISVTKEEAPRAIYRRVQDTIMRAAAEAASISTTILPQPQKQQQMAATTTAAFSIASTATSAAITSTAFTASTSNAAATVSSESKLHRGLSRVDLDSMRRSASVYLAMHINEQLLIDDFEIVFTPILPSE